MPAKKKTKEKTEETKTESQPSKKRTNTVSLEERLKEEEALHYFTRNRMMAGLGSTEIQEAWLELKKKFDKNPYLLEDTLMFEKLKTIALTTRRNLGYSEDGITKTLTEIKELYKPK